MRKNDMAKKMVKMTRKDFIREHEHLTKVLKTGRGRKEEYKEQEEELEKVKYPHRKK